MLTNESVSISIKKVINIKATIFVSISKGSGMKYLSILIILYSYYCEFDSE